MHWTRGQGNGSESILKSCSLPRLISGSDVSEKHVHCRVLRACRVAHGVIRSIMSNAGIVRLWARSETLQSDFRKRMRTRLVLRSNPVSTSGPGLLLDMLVQTYPCFIDRPFIDWKKRAWRARRSFALVLIPFLDNRIRMSRRWRRWAQDRQRPSRHWHRTRKRPRRF